MKKQYTTPGISFVSLSSYSVGGCDVKASYAMGACPVLIEEWGETIFPDMITCDWEPEDGNVCYHVPESGWSVFES